MISKEELETYTTYRDKYQIEKDYLQDLILYSIYSNTTDEFVFKGGTAISKFYNSDRFSEDLDFTLKKMDEKDAISLINKVVNRALKSIQYPTNYIEQPSMNKYGTVEAAIEIQGPRYNGKYSTIQKIVFEIGTRLGLIEKAVPMPRSPIYSDATNYTSLIMDKQEILAEKIRAIMSPTRRHKERDLYDMYYLLGKRVSIKKALTLKKLEESQIDFSKEELLKYIGNVKPVWKDLQPFVQHNLEEYEYVSEKVIRALQDSEL